MSSCVSRQPLPLEAAEKATGWKAESAFLPASPRWAPIPPPSPSAPSLTPQPSSPACLEANHSVFCFLCLTLQGSQGSGKSTSSAGPGLCLPDFPGSSPAPPTPTSLITMTSTKENFPVLHTRCSVMCTSFENIYTWGNRVMAKCGVYSLPVLC